MSYGREFSRSSSGHSGGSSRPAGQSRPAGSGNSRPGGGQYGRRPGGGGTSAGGFGGSRRSFGGPQRFRRVMKVIDHRFLVQKAQPPAEHVEYVSKHTFADFALHPQLQKNIISKGYINPTPIQDQTIPSVLAGKDVVGIANTGTGKTAAFLLPVLNALLNNPQGKALIIAPTRELAVQIKQECASFAAGTILHGTLCIGGMNMERQIDALRRNPQVVIGTPGRLKDLKQQGKLRLDQFTHIVLDEVDHMLDMGFLPDVRLLISYLPQQRQSLFFSATLPPVAVQVMQSFLRDPIHVSVKTQETSLNVDQDVIKLNGRPKLEVLCELLNKPEVEKAIIFGGTKRAVANLTRELYTRRFKVAELHGNRNQNQRQRAVDMFKQGYVRILVATDVAARGLDIPNVTHVINFDLPQSYQEYVHRIGRTGRVDASGQAWSLIP